MLSRNKKVTNRKEKMASQKTYFSLEDIVEQYQAREAESDSQRALTSDKELVKNVKLGTADMMNMLQIVLMRMKEMHSSMIEEFR